MCSELSLLVENDLDPSHHIKNADLMRCSLQSPFPPSLHASSSLGVYIEVYILFECQLWAVPWNAGFASPYSLRVVIFTRRTVLPRATYWFPSPFHDNSGQHGQHALPLFV